MACTDHTFPEERTPEGQLLLGSCLSCGLSALDAIAELVRERDALSNGQEALRLQTVRIRRALTDVVEDGVDTEEIAKRVRRGRDEAVQNDKRLRRMLAADTLYKRARVAEDEVQEARRERDEALARAVDLERVRDEARACVVEAERERDEAREECRQCRADIRRLVEVRDEALAEVERLKEKI